VRLRPFLLAALIFGAAALPGCANSKRNSSAPAYPEVEVPAGITNLDEFAAHTNDFALLSLDHPQREALRQRLLDYLIDYLDRSASTEHFEEATTALNFITDLYAPQELRSAPHRPDPAVAAAAHRVYLAAARHGHESPAMLALAVEQQFGGKNTRKQALHQWQDLEDWILRNGVFSDEAILRHEELEETLEETAAIFPSPFVVQRLNDLYLARYQAALDAIERGSEMAAGAQQRAEVTGYLLIRLHLRADDFASTLAALKKITPDMASGKMMEFIQEAEKSERSANALLTLATQFIPESPDGLTRIPPSFFVQGWGIVDNLARRALTRFPDDPFAHLLLARALRQDGLIDASIHHFEATIAIKEDVREAWDELAILDQVSLERLSEYDPQAAEARLRELEARHSRAVKLWPDRPIRPGLPEAYVAVAHGLYNSGQINQAKKLLERSLTIEPVPEALYLLGTIELKQGKLGPAQTHFSGLVELPFNDQIERVHWETKAHSFLAEIDNRRGKTQAADEQRRVALKQLNSLIAFPSLGEQQRSEYLIERGKIFFALGDVGLAIDDFRQARATAPDRVSSYTEPMLLMVSRGYYDEALEIYHQALKRDEIRDTLKLYFSLWVNDLGQRQGRNTDRDTAAFLLAYKADTWPEKLALHARGKLSYNDLLASASDNGERTEAHFYEALRQWRSGAHDSSTKLMKKVLDSDMMSFFEYDMALHYVGHGELPMRTPSRGTQTNRARIKKAPAMQGPK